MSFIDLFSEKSANYARARPTYPDGLYQFVAGVAPSRGRAWDCATGNGQAAIGLARHFGAVDEIRRVLKPRGVVAVWGYGWTCISPEVDRGARLATMDLALRCGRHVVA